MAKVKHCVLPYFVLKAFISPFLQDIPDVSAFLIQRVPGLVLPADRQQALLVQTPFFQERVRNLYPTLPTQEPRAFLMAEEVHGSDIAMITKPYPKEGFLPSVDGLITAEHGVVLGITVADCAPVWIVDRTGKGVALVHSGKRGTELGIVPKAIRLLQERFSSKARDLLVTIGPCIRQPCYEVDIAQIIKEQALVAGVTDIHDEGICTACHIDRYYSYRKEQGKTGHMLATVMME